MIDANQEKDKSMQHFVEYLNEKLSKKGKGKAGCPKNCEDCPCR